MIMSDLSAAQSERNATGLFTDCRAKLAHKVAKGRWLLYRSQLLYLYEDNKKRMKNI